MSLMNGNIVSARSYFIKGLVFFCFPYTMLSTVNTTPVCMNLFVVSSYKMFNFIFKLHE